MLFSIVEVTTAQSKKDNKDVRLTSANYTKETSKGLILVDFWAAWCKPCRKIAMTLNDLKKDNPLNIRIGKLNIDSYKALAIEKDIQSIPTLILYKEGVEIMRLTGVYSVKELNEEIEKALTK